jgi:hypothetical protein
LGVFERSEHFTKQIELRDGVHFEFAQYHPRRAIPRVRLEKGGESGRDYFENLLRKGCAARETHLYAMGEKLLGLEKNEGFPGSKVIFPRFDTGILNILGELREHKGAIV